VADTINSPISPCWGRGRGKKGKAQEVCEREREKGREKRTCGAKAFSMTTWIMNVRGKKKKGLNGVLEKDSTWGKENHICFMYSLRHLFGGRGGISFGRDHRECERGEKGGQESMAPSDHFLYHPEERGKKGSPGLARLNIPTQEQKIGEKKG